MHTEEAVVGAPSSRLLSLTLTDSNERGLKTGGDFLQKNKFKSNRLLLLLLVSPPDGQNMEGVCSLMVHPFLLTLTA